MQFLPFLIFDILFLNIWVWLEQFQSLQLEFTIHKDGDGRENSVTKGNIVTTPMTTQPQHSSWVGHEND